MKFTIDDSMSITDVAGGLIFVAHLSWIAAFLCLLLIAVTIENMMPGALTLQQGRNNAGR